MNAEKNKELINAIFSGEVDFLEQFADDAVWKVPGFKSFKGKQEIVEKLFAPLEALMDSMGSVVPDNIIAEGDQVVVEAHAVGRVTKKGDGYNNSYCLIYKIRDGKIQQLTEYSDTALAKEVLPELDWTPEA